MLGLRSSFLLRTALLAMVVELLSGCGGTGGGSTFGPSANPLLTITPSAIDFATVRVGTKSSKTVTVTNSGTGTLTISQATLTGSAFSFTGLQPPFSLAEGQSLSFSVAFAPVVAGAASGTLSLSSNAAVPVNTIGLSGTGATYQLKVGANSLNFGNVAVGSNSTQTVALTNSGTGVLTISQISVAPGAFSLKGPALPATLESGQSTSITVTFSPTATGAESGSLSIVSDASESPAAITLAGTGVTYLLSVSPSSINFGTVIAASTSTQTITLTNTGTASLTVSQATVTGAGFSLGGLNLPLTLAAGQSAALNVTFAPSAAGSSAGSVAVVSNASTSPATIALAGTGVTYLLSVNPSSLDFGNVTVASTSTQTITLTNSGTASLTVSQASVTGTGFSLSGLNLPLTLAAGQSAAVNVTFAPSAAGSVAGSVLLTSTASASPATVALSGLGVTYQLAPSVSSLGFGNVGVSLKSVQTVSLTSNGTGSVTISQVTVSGTAFTLTGLNLPATLTPGQSVTLTITFSPSVVGSAAGTLSVISNASGSPMLISLNGTGVTYQLAFSVGSLDFGNVAVNSSSAQTVTLTNSGTASVTISQISVAGAAFSLKSPSLPLTLETGQSTTVTATFSPASVGVASGTISVVSNAPNSPLNLSLAGTGVTYQLTSSPSTVSFGNVTIGDNAILPVTLTSTGTASITISQISVTGPGFTVSSLSLPLSLDPGKSASVSVTFAPTTGGSATGTLTVTSSATSSPLTDALSGTGIHTVDLSWTGSTSTGVVGYNVYRSEASSGPFNVINTSPVSGTSFVDSGVTAGQTYYYATTAIGPSGVESAFSNVASVIVPAP